MMADKLVGLDVEGSDLGIGYPSVAIPSQARISAIDALERKQTHYASVPGVEPLRAATRGFLKSLGLDVPLEQVIITAGAQEACFLALQGLVRQYDDTAFARGDRQARYLAVHDVVRDRFPVAIPAVVAPGVKRALAVRKRTVATMPVDETKGFIPNLAAIEQALEDGNRVIYLESPSLLTGFAYGAEQVRRIADLLQAHDALCVWDQSIAPAVSGEYLSLAEAAPESTAAIGTLWPGLGMEAWQIGYVAAPPACVESLIALKQVMSICTSTPAQWAAVGASVVFGEMQAKSLIDMEAERRQVLESVGDDERVLVGAAVNSVAVNLGSTIKVAKRFSGDEGLMADGASFGAPGVVRVAMVPGAHTAELVCGLLGGAS